MNQPNFPLGSLTAEDARWVRQDDTMPAPRRAHTIENRAHLDALQKASRAAKMAKRRDWTLAIIGGLTGAFCFLYVLPVLLVMLGA